MKSSLIQDLINYLASEQRYFTINELCDHFEVSRRTIFYRIRRANKLLADNDISKIKNERGTGYILDQRSVQLWNELKAHRNNAKDKSNEQTVSQKSRVRQIVWQMIMSMQAISINELAIRLKVSRNTVIADFKTIQSQFPALKVESTPNGHVLNGNENAVRRFVFHELQLDTHGYIGQQIRQLKFPVISDQQIFQYFLALQTQLNAKFTENAYDILNLMLRFSINRISAGRLIKRADTTIPEIEETTDHVVEGVHELLRLNGVNDLQELCFFIELVLCSQVSSIDYIKPSFRQTMLGVTKQIILRYDQIAGTRINSSDFVEALSNHLFATYFRCKFNFEFSARVLNTIEKQFTDMIKFVQIACRPLTQLIGKPISINEIALICLYFISYNDIGKDDLTVLLDQTDGIKDSLGAEVLLVCTSGVSTSAILYTTLHRRYPLISFSKSLSIESLEKLMRMPNKAKLIITTAPLNPDEFDIPVVYARSVLNSQESYKIEQVLRKYFPQLSINQQKSLDNIMKIVQNNATVNNGKKLRADLSNYLFPYERATSNDNRVNLADLVKSQNIKIFRGNEIKGLEQIIRCLCWILTKEQVVTDQYADDIIALIHKYGPYMLLSRNTFLAHAKPSSHTIKVGLAIGILQEPVKIKVQNEIASINCVVLLSPGFNHEHDKALAQLINVVTNHSLFQQFLQAKTSREASQLIKTYYQ